MDEMSKDARPDGVPRMVDAWQGKVKCEWCLPFAACGWCRGSGQVSVGDVCREIRELLVNLEDVRREAEVATESIEWLQQELVVANARRHRESCTLHRALGEAGGTYGTGDATEQLLALVEDARRAVGPAWFAGGVTLAEAIRRKCRALEAGHE